MTVQIIEAREPVFFETDEVRAFFQRAFAPGRPMPADLALSVCRACCASPLALVTLGIEDAEWRALMIGTLPYAPTMSHPNVYFLYNEGSPELRKALVEHGLAWLRAKGYNAFTATNWSPHSNEAWLKLWGPLGTPTKTASTFLFELPELPEEPKEAA